IRMAPPSLGESASLAGKQGPSLFFPAVELLLGEVFAEPLVRGARMRLHALEARDARSERREVAVRLARHALPGEHLEELVHREPARVARRALGRQDVVRPGRLVAERDRGLLAEEERTVVREMRKPPVELARLHLEMLGRVAVRELDCLLARLADHHLAVIAP